MYADKSSPSSYPSINEEGNVGALYGRLHTVMQETGKAYESFFVDGGSTDRTYPLLQKIAVIDPQEQRSV